MSYENSKACKLVATHCAACGRPLVDATSVDYGIGPTCRKKYQYEDALEITEEVAENVRATLASVPNQDLQEKIEEALNEDDSRWAANLLVHHIAHYQKDPESMGAIRLIRALGYESLADRIEKRIKPKIQVMVENGRIEVESPYSETFVACIREIKGRRFDYDNKIWSAPVTQKRELWKALKAAYEGDLAQGPKGPFVI